MIEKASELVPIYAQTIAEIEGSISNPEVSARFYPYVNVNNTIRVRDGKVRVRVSTLLIGAPEDVHRSLAVILVSKLLRRRIPPAAERTYGSFISTEEFRERALEHKRRKGRKVINDSRGSVYDLEEIFENLNKEYFGDAIEKPSIGWSSKRSFRRLGHYDPAHRAIVISRSLDSTTIPAFVVEYVMFHEMLHVKHPTVVRGGRRYSHTPAFKRDESKYAHFDEAEGWIDRNSHRLKEIAGAVASKKRYWGLFD